jgi:hypothetical protein
LNNHNLPDLKIVILNDNDLTGELPMMLIRMRLKKENVKLENNAGFTLPMDIDKLGAIPELNLSHMSIIGHIPPEVGLMESLTSLDLSGNAFEGSVPVALIEMLPLLSVCFLPPPPPPPTNS